MEKIYAFFKSLNYAHLLVLGLVVKAIVFDVSYASFLLAIPVLAYEAYKLYLEARKPDPIQLNEEVQKDLNNIKAKLNAQTFENNIGPTAGMKRFF